MRIALIYHPSFPIPPYDGYGGVQRGIYDLARGLADKGHTIYLFCTATSNIDHPNIQKVVIAERGFYEFLEDQDHTETNRRVYAESVETIKNIEYELGRLVADNKLDLINLRWEDRDMQNICKSFTLPLMMSIHCQVDSEYSNILHDEELLYTFHSETHRLDHPEFARSVVNDYAISMDHIPIGKKTLSLYNETPQNVPECTVPFWKNKMDYLVLISGVNENKSQATAIKIAKQAGLPLILCGSPSTSERALEYFEKQVKPHIDDKTVIHLPNVNEKDKYELLQYALGFLFTAGIENEKWVEPFGRVVSESLAVGTPVVGYRSGGSVVHQVEDGKNGFLFDDIDGAVASIEKLHELDREWIANHARTELSVQRFIDSTEQTMQDILKEHVVVDPARHNK